VTRIVPTLVLAVLIPVLEPELLADPPAAGGVLELLDAELPHAASPITAAAITGAAHHRLRICAFSIHYG
jgi:hypothetical protein